MRAGRVASSLVVAFGIAFAASIALGGCSSGASSEEDPAVVAKRNQAEAQFSDDVDWVADKYEYCTLQLAQTGACVVDGGTKTQSFVIVDPTLKDLNFADALRAARQKVAQVRQILSQIKSNICGALGPFAGLNHPYFYYGGYAQAGVIGQVQGGMDVVFDMSNLQAATFGYKGYGAASLIGGEAGVYAGYGFGNKSGVLDAWSGRFCTASGSVGLPAKLLSAGASVFASPDGTVYGGAVSVSAGLDAIPTPVDGSVFSADWGAWDAGTKALMSKGWFINQKLVTDPATGKQFVQYGSARDMALALLWNAPQPMGISAAAQVLALDIQKRTGLTIEQMCPKEAAEAKNQSPLPAAVQAAAGACGKLPELGGSSSSSGGASSSSGGPGAADAGSDSGLNKTDCGDKSDGWWCLDAAGWMTYCQNHQIKSGCSCKACPGQNGAAGTQAPCTSDIYVCSSN